MDLVWGQGETTFLSTVGYLLACMPHLCEMIQEWRTENAGALLSSPYEDLLDCICNANCDSVETQQHYFDTLASVLAKYLPSLISVRIEDQLPRDPVQVVHEILCLVHSATKTSKSYYEHVFTKTIRLCLYSLMTRPRYLRSFAAQEGAKDFELYLKTSRSFITQSTVSCETFISKCRRCFYAAALSKVQSILCIPVSDASNGASVQQLFDNIYMTVSICNELSEDQKCNAICKGPFEYARAMTRLPYFFFIKLERSSRATAVVPSEYLVVRYQEAGDQITHYYLVAFIISKDTIRPSQAMSGCGVLNLYLNRWSMVSGAVRAMYSFPEIEKNQEIQSEVLLLVYKKAEKQPLKRALSKDAAPPS